MTFIGGLCLLGLFTIGCIAVPWVIGQRRADRIDAALPRRRALPPNVIDLAPRRGRKLR